MEQKYLCDLQEPARWWGHRTRKPESGAQTPTVS